MRAIDEYDGWPTHRLLRVGLVSGRIIGIRKGHAHAIEPCEYLGND